MYRLAISLVVLVSACADGQWARGTRITPTGPLDRSGQEVWASTVETALSLWAEAIGPDCKLPLLIDDGQRSGIDDYGPEALPIRLVPPAEWTLGEHVLGSQDIDGVVIQGTPYDDRVRITGHELGHALGLDHSKEIRSIMYPTMNAWKTFTADDVRLARAAIGCD